FLIILLVAIFAYFPQLSGEFIGDDVGRIEAVPRENAFQTMYDLLGDRPLLIVSVWLDRFFFNFDVFGMRLHNLILLAGLCLTFRILLNKVSETFNSPINPILRDGLLLLFAVHPINTQAVGHIIQRGILLSSLFAVLTTIFLLSSRGDFRKLKWKVAL